MSQYIVYAVYRACISCAVHGVRCTQCVRRRGQYSIVGLVYQVSGVQCIVLCAGGVNSVWGVQGMVGAP